MAAGVLPSTETAVDQKLQFIYIYIHMLRMGVFVIRSFQLSIMHNLYAFLSGAQPPHHLPLGMEKLVLLAA